MGTIASPSRVRSAWQNFVGPEATTLDNTVTAGLAVLGGVAAPACSDRRLPAGRRLTLRLLALDLWGGAWVNNTTACTRWYERPGQSETDHLAFAAMHVHPAVLAWMDDDSSRRVSGPVWAATHYGYLMASTVLIRRHLQRRRLLGTALTGGGIALDSLMGRSRVAPWFAPVFYVKLLLGHAAAGALGA